MPDNVVTVIHWIASKSSGSFFASTYGALAIQLDPNTPGYIPYENLTEPDVVALLVSEMDPGELLEIEQRLDSSLALQQNPLTATGLPWVS